MITEVSSMPVYTIGGSPCSGKSTVAEALADRYGLHYFKVDDHLDRYLKAGAEQGLPACRLAVSMTPDQTWLRDPAVQCAEELRIYEEISGFVLADLTALTDSRSVITEGAAWLPALAASRKLPFDRYISITPTREFQIDHYRRREWVPFVLKDCSDRELAFRNWMERDVLFARAVGRQCADAGYLSVINDGSQSVDVLTDRVAAHFGLSR